MTPQQETISIIESVASAHRGVTYLDIVGPSRTKRVLAARFEAIYQIRTRKPRMSLAQIGAVFGGRDHSTVINALQRYVPPQETDGAAA